MNQEFVNEIVFSILREHPLKINKMTYGEMNIVYDVLLPDREVIIRANELKLPLEGTEHNIRILSQLGIPVPKVIHADITKEKYPFAYIILEKVPGVDLRFVLPEMSKVEISELAKNIVSIQRKVSSLPLGEGYGFAPINKKANSQTWSDYIEWEIHCGLPEIENIVGKKGIDSIKMQTAYLQDYFHQVKPVCFLDDITIKNVMILNGKLQGIIDLDWVCYGDPLNMLGLTQASIIADIDGNSLFYVAELCRYWEISSEEREIIDFYSLIHSMNLIRIRRNNNLINSVQRLENSIFEIVDKLF